MKQQWNSLLLCLILSTLIISSCAESSSASGTPSTEITITVPTNTIKHIQVSSPTPDIMTSTPTAIATLPMNEATQLLLTFLDNNGDCQLPCLWDITPGNSTFKEAETILIPLSSLSDLTIFKYSTESKSWIGGITADYIVGDLRITIFPSLFTYPDKNTVSHVNFIAHAWRDYIGGSEEIFDSTAFGELLAFYRLPNILTQLGKPDSVLIKTYSLKPGDEWKFFYVELIYQEQGIFIQYTTIHSGLVSDNKFLGCLANARVELALYPAGDGDAAWNQFSESHQFVVESFKPLEEVTSMSLDEFYETFRVPTDACIETSSRIWPSGDY